MTLYEAMDYRGENAATLAARIGCAESTIVRYAAPSGMLKGSAAMLYKMAKALDAGFLITEDGAEVELYGNGGTKP